MLYQVNAVIKQAVQNGKMPESFKDIVPESVIDAAEKLIQAKEQSERGSFNEEIAKALLKLRVTFKQGAPVVANSPYTADFLLANGTVIVL